MSTASKPLNWVNIFAVVFAFACVVTASSAMSPPNEPTGPRPIAYTQFYCFCPAVGLQS